MRHVIVVRDQYLDARQQHDLADSLGTIMFSPVQRAIGSNSAISTVQDSPERPPAGFGWHTDLSWTQYPPALGFLTAVTQNPPVEHPLVRTHPTTGRRSLFLSPLYVRPLIGRPWQDSRMMQRLHAMLNDPHVQMRWRWCPGDLAIWDEPAPAIGALTDHHPQQRAMLRCVTA